MSRKAKRPVSEAVFDNLYYIYSKLDSLGFMVTSPRRWIEYKLVSLSAWGLKNLLWLMDELEEEPSLEREKELRQRVQERIDEMGLNLSGGSLESSGEDSSTGGAEGIEVSETETVSVEGEEIAELNEESGVEVSAPTEAGITVGESQETLSVESPQQGQEVSVDDDAGDGINVSFDSEVGVDTGSGEGLDGVDMEGGIDSGVGGGTDSGGVDSSGVD